MLPSPHTFRKSFSAFLALFWFLSQVVLAHSAEINFWSERRLGHTAVERTALFPSSTIPPPRFPTRIPKNLEPTLAPLISALSPNFGSIRKIRLSPKKSNPIVIYIQDVHRNPEAQRNISKLVQELITQKKVDLVALEGAFGPLDFSWYRTHPHPEAVTAVADYLFKEQRISGPAYAALTLRSAAADSEQALPPFVGVDEKRHYDANVKAYQESAPLIALYKKRLEDQKRAMAERKNKFFNPQLKKFDDCVEAYHQGTLSLGKYVRTLTHYRHELSPKVEMYRAVLEMESKLNFPQVEKERTVLIAQLIKKLTKSENDDLFNHSVAYRSGRLTPADFYSYFQELCSRHAIDLKRVPALNDYIHYVLLSENLDVDGVLQETAAIEKKIYAALTQTEEERRLVETSRYFYLVQKLLDFALTRQEWEEYEQMETPPNLPIVRHGEEFSSFEKFYAEAEARDRVMAVNLENAMADSQAKVAVLVTGGFHSDGMTSQLQAKGMSIISVVPTISKIDDEKGSAYLSVFTQEKTPLDKLFSGEKLFLAEAPLIPPRRGKFLVKLTVHAAHGLNELNELGIASADGPNGSRITVAVAKRALKLAIVSVVVSVPFIYKVGESLQYTIGLIGVLFLVYQLIWRHPDASTRLKTISISTLAAIISVVIIPSVFVARVIRILNPPPPAPFKAFERGPIRTIGSNLRVDGAHGRISRPSLSLSWWSIVFSWSWVIRLIRWKKPFWVKEEKSSWIEKIVIPDKSNKAERREWAKKFTSTDEFDFDWAPKLELWMLPGFGYVFLYLFSKHPLLGPVLDPIISIVAAGLLASLLHGNPFPSNEDEQNTEDISQEQEQTRRWEQSFETFLIRWFDAVDITFVSFFPVALIPMYGLVFSSDVGLLVLWIFVLIASALLAMDTHEYSNRNRDKEQRLSWGSGTDYSIDLFINQLRRAQTIDQKQLALVGLMQAVDGLIATTETPPGKTICAKEDLQFLLEEMINPEWTAPGSHLVNFYQRLLNVIWPLANQWHPMNPDKPSDVEAMLSDVVGADHPQFDRILLTFIIHVSPTVRVDFKKEITPPVASWSGQDFLLAVKAFTEEFEGRIVPVDAYRTTDKIDPLFLVLTAALPVQTTGEETIAIARHLDAHPWVRVIIELFFQKDFPPESRAAALAAYNALHQFIYRYPFLVRKPDFLMGRVLRQHPDLASLILANVQFENRTKWTSVASQTSRVTTLQRDPFGGLARLAKNFPAIYRLFNFQESCLRLIQVASLTRLQLSYIFVPGVSTFTLLDYARLHEVFGTLTNDPIYFTPVTGSFRRFVLFGPPSRTGTAPHVEAKIPGQNRNRWHSFDDDVVFYKRYVRAFGLGPELTYLIGQIILTGITRVNLYGDIRAVSRHEPLQLLLFDLSRDRVGQRLENLTFAGLETLSEIYRPYQSRPWMVALDLFWDMLRFLARTHALRYSGTDQSGGTDIHIGNSRLLLPLRTSNRLGAQFVGDVSNFRRVQGTELRHRIDTEWLSYFDDQGLNDPFRLWRETLPLDALKELLNLIYQHEFRKAVEEIYDSGLVIPRDLRAPYQDTPRVSKRQIFDLLNSFGLRLGNNKKPRATSVPALLPLFIGALAFALTAAKGSFGSWLGFVAVSMALAYGAGVIPKHVPLRTGTVLQTLWVKNLAIGFKQDPDSFIIKVLVGPFLERIVYGLSLLIAGTFLNNFLFLCLFSYWGAWKFMDHHENKTIHEYLFHFAWGLFLNIFLFHPLILGLIGIGSPMGLDDFLRNGGWMMPFLISVLAQASVDYNDYVRGPKKHRGRFSLITLMVTVVIMACVLFSVTSRIRDAQTRIHPHLSPAEEESVVERDIKDLLGDVENGFWPPQRCGKSAEDSS